MKKLLQFTATAAIAATALSACSPPGEVDSDKKVKTATEIAAPTEKVTSSEEAKVDAAEVGMPKFIDCAGSPEELPTALSLDCSSNKDKLTEITWTSITQDKAQGTGTRVKEDASGTKSSTQGVPVVLSKPVKQDNGLVYSQVEVDGSVIPLG